VLQKTPLHYCVEASLFTTAKKLLLRNDVNVNAKDKYGNTPLHLRVENENTTIGRILLAKEGIDISLENNDGETPFSLSIKRNKTNMIRLFLSLVNLDEQDQFKRTLLHWAAETNAPYALAALLNRTSKNIKDINGDTSLTIALKNNNDKAVMMLSETKHFDVDTMDNNGDTPLHIAFSHGSNYVIQKVLKTKMNINSPNNNAETPLHVACKLNNKTAVQILKEKVANLTFVDKNLRTPLITAAYFNNTEAAIMLFHGSANQNDPFLTIDTDDLLMSEINYKIQQNPTDARDMEGNTVLHYCAMFQNVEMARFLVTRGARATILNSYQETAATIVVNQDS
jgi:ankyrin repeat protein